MIASNPSSKPGSRPGARVPWNITPAGSRLARYLDYVDRQPQVASDITFGEIGIPPEQFDDDRQPEPPMSPLECVQELMRLHQELDMEIQCLFAYAEGDSDRFREQRVRVANLRERIKAVRTRCSEGE